MRILNLKERPEYIEPIAELLFRQWGHLRPGSTLESAIKRIETRCAGTTIPSAFVAEINSQPVGTVSIVEYDMDTRKDISPWVSSLFVWETFRHQNIGRKLVRFIESYAKDIGEERIYLFTPDKQKMYSFLGWKHLEETEYQSRNVSIMVINLDVR